MKQIKLSNLEIILKQSKYKMNQSFYSERTKYFIYKLKEIIDETTEIEINVYSQFSC